jgi:hypothetical protein
MFGGRVPGIDELVRKVEKEVERAVVETDKDTEIFHKASFDGFNLYRVGEVEDRHDATVSLYNAYKEFGEHFPAGCYFMWYKQTVSQSKNWVEEGTNFFRGLVELAKTYENCLDAESAASFISGRFLEMKTEETQREFQRRVYESLETLDYQTRRENTMGDYSTNTSAFTGSLLCEQP